MPIHVGKALHPEMDLGIQGDDTGDNISLKNANYCELTGMYWAWKNLKDVDVIGLCHYRRYFDFHGQCRKWHPVDAFKSSAFENTDLTVPENVIDKIRDGYAVVAKPKYYMTNLSQDYCHCHVSDDYRVMRSVIKEKYSDYWVAFCKIMDDNNALIHFNMFLMTWHDFDAYCTWLFDVLGEVEKRTDTTHYTPFQARIYGYMAERLFNVYLYANKFRLNHRPIIWFNDNAKDISTFTLLQRNLRGCLATKISSNLRGKY